MKKATTITMLTQAMKIMELTMATEREGIMVMKREKITVMQAIMVIIMHLVIMHLVITMENKDITTENITRNKNIVQKSPTSFLIYPWTSIENLEKLSFKTIIMEQIRIQARILLIRGQPLADFMIS